MAKHRQPNTALAALMAEAGFSRLGLADRVRSLGEIRNAPDRHYNHSSVSRWLQGQHPRRPVPEILAEIFTLQLGRRITTADLGMAGHDLPADLGLELSATHAASIRTALTLWAADLDDRRAITNATVDPAAYATAALRWLVGPREPLPTIAGSRRIGAADVEEVRQVTSAFRIVDNRLGGGQVRIPVVEYLHTHVGPMLRDGRGSEEARKALFSAAADLTKLAAWLYHDIDHQGLAQRYLIQALAMARHAEDPALGGEILAAMSQQAHYIARPGIAVDMARAAQTAAQRAGVPVLMTECLVMEAHGYAGQGEARAVAHALTRAEAAFDRATDEQLPPWLDYFDEAYFAAKIAHCFRDLDQPEKTEEYALRSLDMDASYRRGRTFNISILAMAVARQGRVEEACQHGRDAVDLAAGLTSARVYRYVADVVRALDPYASTREASEFTAYAEERMPVLRVRGERPSPSPRR